MTDLELPNSELLADWIEVSVLISESGHLSRDRFEDLALVEIGVPSQSVALAHGIIMRRAATLGDFYPFTVNELAMVRRERALQTQYAALLHLTPGSVARQLVQTVVTPQMSELLEELTESALSSFWGVGGQALSFGYPSRSGRPEAFDQAVLWLSQQIGIQPGSGYRNPRRKDGGVDVVAWRSFNDRRSGFPLALAQCTIQSETFTKTTDIDLRLWASWLAMDSDPLSLLVIPGTIRGSGPEWQQLTTVVTVIERMRLMELLGRDIERNAGWQSDWVSSTSYALRQVMYAAEL